jgi:hypothetical protein
MMNDHMQRRLGVQDAAWISVKEPPHVCQSRSGHWWEYHDFDRDGICIFCDLHERAQEES